MSFIEARLDVASAILADGHECVCAFVNDCLDRTVLTRLGRYGVKLIALRCAGFNNLDLSAARALGLCVVRVPAYSPDAVAEHTVALILALTRNIHRAYIRVREGNFVLDGLLGFGLRGRTVGIVGAGRIGMCVARILRGFGCHVLAFDLQKDQALTSMGGRYVQLRTLFAQSDIVTLHCPLTPKTHHLINEEAISAMSPGVMLINTSRGAVVDARALIRGLKAGRIGHLGLDVYEEEGDLFFEDLSNRVIRDDVFARLLTFPNVLITAHQAFFTREAMTAIAETTIANVTSYAANGRVLHEISVEKLA